MASKPTNPPLRNVHLIEIRRDGQGQCSYEIHQQADQAELRIKPGGWLLFWSDTEKATIEVQKDKKGDHGSPDGTTTNSGKQKKIKQDRQPVLFKVRDSTSDDSGHRILIKCDERSSDSGRHRPRGREASAVGGPVMKVEE